MKEKGGTTEIYQGSWIGQAVWRDGNPHVNLADGEASHQVYAELHLTFEDLPLKQAIGIKEPRILIHGA